MPPQPLFSPYLQPVLAPARPVSPARPAEPHGSRTGAGPRVPAHLWGHASPQLLPQGSSADPDQPNRPGRSGVSSCRRSTVARALPPQVEAEPGERWRAPAASPVPAGSPPAAPSKLTDPRSQMACGSAKTCPPPPPPSGSGPTFSPRGSGALSPPAWLQNKGNIRICPSHGVPGPDPGSAGTGAGSGEAGASPACSPARICFGKN